MEETQIADWLEKITGVRAPLAELRNKNRGLVPGG